MKLTTGILILAMMAGGSLAGKAAAQSPDAIDNARSAAKALQQKQANGANSAQAGVSTAKPAPGAPAPAVKPAVIPGAKPAPAAPAAVAKAAPAVKPAAAANPVSTSGQHNQLQRVNVVQATDSIRIEINSSGAVTPKVSKLDSPARILVELPGTADATPRNHIAIGNGGVKGVRIGMDGKTPPTTSVVVDLEKACAYELTPGSSDKLVLTLHTQAAAQAAAKTSPAPARSPAVQPQAVAKTAPAATKPQPSTAVAKSNPAPAKSSTPAAQPQAVAKAAPAAAKVQPVAAVAQASPAPAKSSTPAAQPQAAAKAAPAAAKVQPVAAVAQASPAPAKTSALAAAQPPAAAKAAPAAAKVQSVAAKPAVASQPAAPAKPEVVASAAPKQAPEKQQAGKGTKAAVPAPSLAPATAGTSAEASKPQPKPEQKKWAMNGKRDPFFSPVVQQPSGSGCSTGKKCLEIGNINLRGVVKSDSGFIAVVTNNLNKAYFLRENDPVFNGYVVKITSDSVVFQETVEDKLGKPLTREVVKRIFTPAV